MNKKLIVLPALVLAGAIGGVYFWQQQQKNDEDGQLVLYGNVDIREAQLAFNSSEHIDAILVQEGDRVKKGQLLARLHSEVLEARLSEAQAQWQAQQQVLARLEAGSRKEEVSKARAELAAAKARARSARATYKRLVPMLKKKLVSPEDVENARAAADAADAEMKAVQQALTLLKLGPRKEDIAIARAVLASRKAAVTLAKQRLDDANLYAPADGIIRNRILEPGDMAFPQTPALTLAFINPVWVRTYLPEPALGKISLGMAATIYTDSFPGKAYQGWVGYISPTAEFTPKNVQTPELRTRLVYSVRIFACNPQDELRLGMPATVRIAIDQPPARQQAARKNCAN
ncbi:ABC-type efflux pump membrane fusion component YbhG [hydrothermal vent metagenome]|uniref:ABC-type efflux pump membrane fusion component YbhG n=1 Tax=hydrothermal vent metagenome TaxID=652676 RepID=A0A3B1B4Q7_9ZZZZ